MLYMVTFTINIPPMLAYIPYMDPMGNVWFYHVLPGNQTWLEDPPFSSMLFPDKHLKKRDFPLPRLISGG